MVPSARLLGMPSKRDFKEEGGQNAYFDEISNDIDSSDSTAWVRGYCGSMVKVSGKAYY